MPNVTEEQLEAAKVQFIADIDALHSLVTASDTATVTLPDGAVVPSLKKLMKDISNKASSYDFHVWVEEKPKAYEVLLYVSATRPIRFPANLAGSNIKAYSQASAEAALIIYNNGQLAGTITFAPGEIIPVINTNGEINVGLGEDLVIIGPGAQDATLQRIIISLLAAVV